jgi:hypothetical protein
MAPLPFGHTVAGWPAAPGKWVAVVYLRYRLSEEIPFSAFWNRL